MGARPVSEKAMRGPDGRHDRLGRRAAAGAAWPCTDLSDAARAER
jgi:hypothetical protein